MEMTELTPNHKALIYTLGVCEDLVAKGLLEGGRYKLGEEGRQILARLKKEGYRPTEDELMSAFETLQCANRGDFEAQESEV